ncbi:inter-alpha-trypsin inhibitor heavy chain H4-like [Onthophagus taurus]|uniref:inter-alpha-trypsin inhibitor heavy chain H4-like n=1 Tax=Onthophagus taurus TaxID=166361 RepID=UPI0039BE1FD6
MKRKLLLFFAFITTSSSFNLDPFKSDLIITSNSLEQSLQSKSRLIRSADKDFFDDDVIPDEEKNVPKIYSMRIESNVTNRYAQTLITSKVRNDANSAQEAIFTVILPEKAFISKFIMNINGQDYPAYVKEKEEAKKIYENALEMGQTAAHVVSRDSNRFTVSVNLEPSSKATFYLTYEELLERKNNIYELVVNINPRQPVKNLEVEIQESLPLRMVRVAPIRSGNEIIEFNEELDPHANIERVNETCAKIYFNPNVRKQKEFAKLMKHPEKQGLSGQFIVQYDVERTQNGGEVLLEDGYFIHFFAPPEMEPLRKNVIFVLDTSGSMYGTKIDQLKSAMRKILNELHPNDKFALIEFSTKVHLLNLDDTKITYSENLDVYLPPSNDVTQANIQKAESIISGLWPSSLTNIYDALMFALNLINRLEGDPNEPQPIIVFLTDGEATVGKRDDDDIIEGVTNNNKYKTPIYCLSFGRQAEKKVLQKISLKNNGFSRHIYEGGDASIQLQDFYRSISSPIMNNVTFKYVSEAKEVTKTIFPIMFNGSEIVVTGKIDKNFETPPIISALTTKGRIDFIPEIKKPIGKLERMWAYLTVQQLLQEKEISKNNSEEIRNKALNIALKYSFVTPVSSMVVVKPNSTNSVNLEDAGVDEPVANRLVQNSYFSGGNYRHAIFQPAGSRRGLSGISSYSRPSATKSLFSAAPDNIVSKRRLIAYDNHYTHYQPSNNKVQNINDLKTKMPWINNVLRNNTLITDKGSYKLDVTMHSADGLSCPLTPLNGSGHCKYIHECPNMLQHLTDMQIFGQYQCDLNGYAAICCPITNS